MPLELPQNFCPPWAQLFFWESRGTGEEQPPPGPGICHEAGKGPRWQWVPLDIDPRDRWSPAGDLQVGLSHCLSCSGKKIINHLPGEPEPRGQTRRAPAPSWEHFSAHTAPQGCTGPHRTCALIGQRCPSSRHMQPCLAEGSDHSARDLCAVSGLYTQTW